MSNFTTGQPVKVTESHNQFTPSDQVYNVGAINRILGVYSVILLLNGKVMGAIDQNKLKTA